jgi:ABC-2 type transport system permease protein
MRGFRSGFRVQLSFFRASPDSAIPLLTAPLFTIIFSMVLRHGGRPDLSGYAVIAPFYMSLWWFAIFNGGMVIQTERWEGTIDYLVAAPSSFASVILGRISTIMVAGLVAFAEVWLFGRYVLHAHVAIRHPYILAASLVLTLFAMTTTSLLMANLFVLSRTAVTFSNAASYPLYLLGGILVPVALLPGWLQPITNVVFLSWSSRLLRASLDASAAQNAGFDLAMLFALGLAAAIAASAIMTRILRRMGQTGELALQ